LARTRIYEIAKELGLTSKELIDKLADLGMPDLKAANSVDDDEHALIVHMIQDDGSTEEAAASSDAKPAGDAGASDAAAPVKEVQVGKAADEAEPTVIEPGEAKAAGSSLEAKHHEGEGDPRPPVVSVLGHIDHGKTTLLDAIRASHLADKEAGGITQGIAAYQADLGGKRITFIDTPGHAAFTGMRARGAQVTDIAILVVAADDGVMAQTVEAIDHIKAAGVPLIVAINKIDKPNANLDKVISDLAQQGLTPEAWGGDTITVEVSALQNQNIEELLEMILLVAEMEDLRGDAKADLEAVVIESHVATGRGPVATAIVKNGTLAEKDWAVAGSTSGRIKALTDGAGHRVENASPGQAIEILGFDDVPEVGTPVIKVKNQAAARKAIQADSKKTAPAPESHRPMTLEDFFQEAEEAQKLQVILKAATTGALEAARREIEGLDFEGLDIEVLSAGVGDISESDVILASTVAGECPVIGFGVKADSKASRVAERDGVALLVYEIIYDLVDELTRIVRRALGPEYREVELGVAEVRDTFKVPAGVVAGCYVADGRIFRRGGIRVIRGGETVHEGEIASLRRFEDDVREVQSGRECGIRIRDFDDVQVGDRLVVFELEEVAHE